MSGAIFVARSGVGVGAGELAQARVGARAADEASRSSGA